MPDTDGEILRALGRLEGKLDSFLSDRVDDRQAHDDLEKRVRTLETRQAYWLGGTALGTFLLTHFGGPLIALVKGS